MNRKKIIIIALAMVSLLSSLGYASNPNVGTLTIIQGEVRVFTNPGKKAEAGPSPRALFEGEYYSVREAKIGDRIEHGNIVRASPGSSARVIFDNGDQIHVGSGTAYRIKWGGKDKVAETQLQLMHGKVRGIIEKGGPRSKLQIKTKSATMGVRGTDFFIEDDAAKAGTQVTVLRGAVELKPESPKAKPVEIKSGFSAVIPPPPPPPPAPKNAEEKKAQAEAKKIADAAPPPTIEVAKSTQEDLIEVQKTSFVKKEVQAQMEAEASPEVKEKLKALEQQAVKTTIADIKEHDPKMYAQIQANPNAASSVDEINTSTVREQFKEAPKRSKPEQKDLEGAGKDAYDKYFKF